MQDIISMNYSHSSKFNFYRCVLKDAALTLLQYNGKRASSKRSPRNKAPFSTLGYIWSAETIWLVDNYLMQTAATVFFH